MIGGGLVVALAATIAPLPPPADAPGASLTVRLPALVQMAVLALFALLRLVTLAERLAAWWAARGAGAPAPAARRGAVVRLGDPRLEADPRVAIVLAWARFEGALAAARAARAPWQTPAELARAALARLPLPRPAAERL